MVFVLIWKVLISFFVYILILINLLFIFFGIDLVGFGGLLFRFFSMGDMIWFDVKFRSKFNS